MKQKDLEFNQIFYEVITMLNGGKPEPAPDIAELKAADLDRYTEARANEADKLIASLDNELLGPDERKQLAERLTNITDELKRADQARRKLERFQALAS